MGEVRQFPNRGFWTEYYDELCQMTSFGNNTLEKYPDLFGSLKPNEVEKLTKIFKVYLLC